MKTKDLNDIKLIAVDLDGTLLTREKTVSERTQKALDMCRARGIKLAFNTGRGMYHSAPFLSSIMPDAASIGYGARVFIEGEAIFSRCMSPKTVNGILRGTMEASKLRGTLRSDEYCYTDRSDIIGDGLFLDREAEFTGRMENLCVWDLPGSKAIALASDIGCALTQLDGDRWCNFSARGVSKGAGMRLVMRRLGLKRGQALAFGDESCDVGFFRECGVGVALGNADKFTLENADFITESNDRDGIAVFLERYIL